MSVHQLFLWLSCFSFVAGACGLTHQIYKLVLLDAKARGMKNPEIWGIATAGRGNALGLFLYFNQRKDYPILQPSPELQAQKGRHKRWALFSLGLTTLGAIGILAAIFLIVK